jgi:hypothetical protein
VDGLARGIGLKVNLASGTSPPTDAAISSARGEIAAML